MVNLSFFRDNAIPAMAVMVSGGALTEESYSKIVNYFSNVRGQGSMNRIVVLEATTEASEMAALDGSSPAPKVDIKPMLSDRQHEGLFSQYIKEASDKVRQSFRLPPIYIGSAEEYNRASAFASMQTAEQQVFVPERTMWDNFLREVVLRDFYLRYWVVRSAQPSYNDPQEISQLLNVLGAQGALTPNICIDLANRYLNTNIEPVTDEWGDMPWNATLVNLNRGAKIVGFEYITQFITDTIAGTPAPAPTNEIAKSVHTMLDELMENVNRVFQQVQ
jgi:capsid portal protein